MVISRHGRGEPVWVERIEKCRFGLAMPYDVEAMAFPDAKHPSGKDHLVLVHYLYVTFNGWVRRDCVRPRRNF